MKRVAMPERPNWQKQADDDGFLFHTFDDGPYWFEAAAYEFSLRQIEEDLEDVTDELYEMCLTFVEAAVRSDTILTSLCIPQTAWPVIADSWERNEGALYGRMDLRYDGSAPAKLLEFNADTPTSVYEAAFFQWGWLEDQIKLDVLPWNADQFNSVHDKLIAGFGALPMAEKRMHFACARESEEDRATTEYLADCALQAGIATKLLYVDDIGADAAGNFNDAEDEPINWLFKLYPWEWLFEEDYHEHLLTCSTNFVEPAWKAVLSNKGMLAHLWQMYEGHPNLLPAFFETDPRVSALEGSYARKPLFAREGANITLFEEHAQTHALDGPYGEEGHILQALAPLPQFDGWNTVIGSWVVNGQACGIGIREDATPITTDDARFVPHYIRP